MSYDETLARRVRPLLSKERGFTEKKLFGGIGFLLDGNMCVGVWKEFLILRLGTEEAESALQQPGVNVFDITGKPMRGWVMVEHVDLADPQLTDWVEMAVRFVRTLEAK